MPPVLAAAALMPRGGAGGATWARTRASVCYGTWPAFGQLQYLVSAVSSAAEGVLSSPRGGVSALRFGDRRGTAGAGERRRGV